MKKIILFILLCVPFSTILAQKNQEGQYEVELAEIGQPGTLVVRVWYYAKNANIADDVFRECAIKGALFRGFEDVGRMKGRKALVSENDDAYKDYFEDFFDKKKYQDYSRIALDGYVEQNNIIRIKKLYKVAKIVVISYNDLRRKLESDNIIKGLNNGF